MSFKFAKISIDAIIPTRAHPYDAGMDISSIENVTISARSQFCVGTGLAVSIPNDCYARIAPRSGLAFKNSIDVMAGVIDHGYTNEIKVILYNHGDKDFEIKKGDRIAQVIFEKIYIPQVIQEVSYLDLLDESNSRGLNGFGSSGV